jgi:hypothetical protein
MGKIRWSYSYGISCAAQAGALYILATSPAAGAESFLAELKESKTVMTYDTYVDWHGKQISMNKHLEYTYSTTDGKTVTLGYKVNGIRDVRPFSEKHPHLYRIYQLGTIISSL